MIYLYICAADLLPLSLRKDARAENITVNFFTLCLRTYASLTITAVLLALIMLFIKSKYSLDSDLMPDQIKGFTVICYNFSWVSSKNLFQTVLRYKALSSTGNLRKCSLNNKHKSLGEKGHCRSVPLNILLFRKK